MARDDDAITAIARLRADVDALQRLGASRWGVAGDVWHVVGAGGEPAFQNSWVNFGSGFQGARFRRENGVVRIEGLVKSGTSNTAVFTLPAEYRPSATQHHVARGNDAGDFFAQVQVSTGGDVIALPSGGGSGAIDLAVINCTFGLG
jgi:hypothetical protein